MNSSDKLEAMREYWKMTRQKIDKILDDFPVEFEDYYNRKNRDNSQPSTSREKPASPNRTKSESPRKAEGDVGKKIQQFEKKSQKDEPPKSPSKKTIPQEKTQTTKSVKSPIKDEIPKSPDKKHKDENRNQPDVNNVESAPNPKSKGEDSVEKKDRKQTNKSVFSNWKFLSQPSAEVLNQAFKQIKVDKNICLRVKKLENIFETKPIVNDKTETPKEESVEKKQTEPNEPQSSPQEPETGETQTPEAQTSDRPQEDFRPSWSEAYDPSTIQNFFSKFELNEEFKAIMIEADSIYRKIQLNEQDDDTKDQAYLIREKLNEIIYCVSMNKLEKAHEVSIDLAEIIDMINIGSAETESYVTLNKNQEDLLNQTPKDTDETIHSSSTSEKNSEDASLKPVDTVKRDIDESIVTSKPPRPLTSPRTPTQASKNESLFNKFEKPIPLKPTSSSQQQVSSIDESKEINETETQSQLPPRSPRGSSQSLKKKENKNEQLEQKSDEIQNQDGNKESINSDNSVLSNQKEKIFESSSSSSQSNISSDNNQNDSNDENPNISNDKKQQDSLEANQQFGNSEINQSNEPLFDTSIQQQFSSDQSDVTSSENSSQNDSKTRESSYPETSPTNVTSLDNNPNSNKKSDSLSSESKESEKQPQSLEHESNKSENLTDMIKNKSIQNLELESMPTEFMESKYQSLQREQKEPDTSLNSREENFSDKKYVESESNQDKQIQNETNSENNESNASQNSSLNKSVEKSEIGDNQLDEFDDKREGDRTQSKSSHNNSYSDNNKSNQSEVENKEELNQSSSTHESKKDSLSDNQDFEVENTERDASKNISQNTEDNLNDANNNQVSDHKDNSIDNSIEKNESNELSNNDISKDEFELDNPLSTSSKKTSLQDKEGDGAEQTNQSSKSEEIENSQVQEEADEQNDQESKKESSSELDDLKNEPSGELDDLKNESEQSFENEIKDKSLNNESLDNKNPKDEQFDASFNSTDFQENESSIESPKKNIEAAENQVDPNVNSRRGSTESDIINQEVKNIEETRVDENQSNSEAKGSEEKPLPNEIKKSENQISLDKTKVESKTTDFPSSKIFHQTASVERQLTSKVIYKSSLTQQIPVQVPPASSSGQKNSATSLHEKEKKKFYNECKKSLQDLRSNDVEKKAKKSESVEKKEEKPEQVEKKEEKPEQVEKKEEKSESVEKKEEKPEQVEKKEEKSVLVENQPDEESQDLQSKLDRISMVLNHALLIGKLSPHTRENFVAKLKKKYDLDESQNQSKVIETMKTSEENSTWNDVLKNHPDLVNQLDEKISIEHKSMEENSSALADSLQEIIQMDKYNEDKELEEFEQLEKQFENEDS